MAESWTRLLRTSTLILLVGLWAGCAVQARSLRSPEQLRWSVRDAELRRDVEVPEIRAALGSQYATLRVLGLRALARSEESGTSTLAVSLLGDADPSVGGWAAFALGQIGDAHGEAALLESLSSISRAPAQVVLALARSGTASTAIGLTRLLEDKRSEVVAAAALGLGLVAKQRPGVLDAAKVHPKLAPLLGSPKVEVRYGASYAFSRLPGPEAPALLVAVLRDPEPEIRMNAVRGIGASLGSPRLLDTALSDPDWRVRAEAARALGVIGKGAKPSAEAAVQRLIRLGATELGSLGVASPISAGLALHVLRSVIDSALGMGAAGKRVLTELDKGYTALRQPAPETAHDRARFHCELAFALDVLTQKFRRIPTCGDASIRAWRRWSMEARFLAKKKTPDLPRLLELKNNQDSLARLAMVEAIGSIESAEATQALVELLGEAELIMSTAAASMLAGRLESPDPGLLARFGQLLDRAAKDPDPGFVSGVLDTLVALGPKAASLKDRVIALRLDPRTPVRRRVVAFLRALGETDMKIGPSPATTVDQRPAPYHEALKAEVVTARGRFQLELWGELAPRAVGSFMALARAGLYKGRVFHRVVPGFVTQGGGERGDGWGSPGYTIEDECSPTPFDRGVLGIATSGRDTGGSQFFFMHARHPHLEGAYTAFGRITGGQDVAEALQVDDEIQDIVISGLEEPRPSPPPDA